MDDRLRRSRKQERRGAFAFGGRVTPGSGNQSHTKNDVRTGTESIEFKSTSRKSYALSLVELQSAWVNSVQDNRRSLFGIEYVGVGNVLAPTRFIILPEDDYLELTGRERHGSKA